MGAVSGIAGGGALKDVLGQAGRTIGAEGAGIGGILQQILGNLNSIVAQGEKPQGLGGAGAQGLLQSFQSDISKLAFIAVLQKAISKAGSSGHFNVETAINDLWVALDGVRKGQQANNASLAKRAQAGAGGALQLQQQVQANQEMYQMLSNMMKSMGDLQKSIIQNLR
jgi:hypothetical protein